MSKTKNRCQHVFVNGPNKGEKCLKCCDGNYCNRHTKIKSKSISKPKSVPTETSPNKTDRFILRLIKSNRLDEADLFDIKMELKKMEDDCTRFVRLYHGYAIRIDPDHTIPIKKKVLLYIQSEEFKNSCLEQYNELDSKSQKAYGFFDGFFDICKEKYLSYPNTYINVIPYNGSTDSAKKKISEVIESYNQRKEQLTKLRVYIKEREAKEALKLSKSSNSSSLSSSPKSKKA